MGIETNSQTHQQPTTLRMKSFVSFVFLNIALARPDHGVLHHGAHHSVHHPSLPVHHAAHQVVHHQPAVHHAVHHQPAAVHHAVHHQPAAVHHAVHSVHQPMLHHASQCSPQPTRLSRKCPRTPWRVSWLTKMP